MSKRAPGGDSSGSHVLDTAGVAQRLGMTPGAVLSGWRRGHFPAPVNYWQRRNYRWSLAVVEQYERGEWQQGGAA